MLDFESLDLKKLHHPNPVENIKSDFTKNAVELLNFSADINIYSNFYSFLKVSLMYVYDNSIQKFKRYSIILYLVKKLKNANIFIIISLDYSLYACMHTHLSRNLLIWNVSTFIIRISLLLANERGLNIEVASYSTE